MLVAWKVSCSNLKLDIELLYMSGLYNGYLNHRRLWKGCLCPLHRSKARFSVHGLYSTSYSRQPFKRIFDKRDLPPGSNFKVGII